MEMYELAKLKIDRTIKMGERFEQMNEEEFKRFISILENAMMIMPVRQNNFMEKRELLAYVNYLNNMEFKRFGYVFKGFSRKGSVLLTKRDVENLVWRAHSLLF